MGTKWSELDTATPASSDLVPFVDVSDTAAEHTAGMNKTATFAAVISALGLATDAEVTAALAALATIATTGSASNLTSGTVPTARLGSGTANSSTFLRGDSTFAAPPTSTGGDLYLAANYT